MKLKKLVDSLGRSAGSGHFRDAKIKGISCNSKTVKKGFLFVAVKGARKDGSSFIQEAISKGVKAIVAESFTSKELESKERIAFIKVKDSRAAVAGLAAAFYRNPSSKLKVIGVTGTNGKTTITYLLEAIIRNAGNRPAVIGTVNYRFRDKVMHSGNTTPGPLELQSLLLDMKKGAVDYVLMEVSSHALEQKRTSGIKFNSAIFTNLTQDHLDYHKTLENYFQCKAELFRGLSKDAFAVINNDDPYARRINWLTRARVVTYGIGRAAQIMAKNISSDSSRTEFDIVHPGGCFKIKSALIGRHNISNILAASAWALNARFKPEIIIRAIKECANVPGRLQRVPCKKRFSVFVDYAHTEDALKNIILALKGLTHNRLIVVFGCGGQRDKTKRPKMGRVVTDLADYAIITSDNPRCEDPRMIMRDIVSGIKKNNFCLIPDRLKAIRKSLSLASPGDIVVVAGKGHENYQVLKNKTIAFDDSKVVKRCLALMN